jgi:hypothetical protein
LRTYHRAKDIKAIKAMLPRTGPDIQASLLVNLGCGVVNWVGEVVGWVGEVVDWVDEVVDEVVVEVGEELEVKVKDGASDKCQWMCGTHRQWRFWGNHGSLRW